jgi:hypothetical protein
LAVAARCECLVKEWPQGKSRLKGHCCRQWLPHRLSSYLTNITQRSNPAVRGKIGQPDGELDRS